MTDLEIEISEIQETILAIEITQEGILAAIANLDPELAQGIKSLLLTNALQTDAKGFVVATEKLRETAGFVE